ncbi:hypothetical protein [Lactobacillus sp. Sy-1]|uniref:hypothetical protein n=1 Tax=Lactobacillus sp. Sy-1 TaxID=2109645 RepID=UPI001C5AC620|nr:hypothetical protein [Lactobacillus sp. Sy-1]MBW1606102.1 hypothetical protein [Lactobacillus sp. Sy-1]
MLTSTTLFITRFNSGLVRLGPVNNDKEMAAKATRLVPTNIITEKTTGIGNGTADLSIVIGGMLMALGCFIGVMSASMMVFSQFEEALNAGSSRLQAFGMYELTFLTMAVLGPILSTISFKLITGISVSVALQMYLQSFILTFVSAQYVSIFTIWLGRIGLLFNLPMALVQTLASGAMVPAELLPIPYHIFASILPIPFTYQSYMSIFSGINKANIIGYDGRLIIMGLISAAIAYGIVNIRKFHKHVNANVS